MINTKNIYIQNVPQELQGLAEMALNLWWNWNPYGFRLFEGINPYLWKETEHNPIKLLKSLSQKDYENLLKNRDFLREYKHAYALFREYMNEKKVSDIKPVAYFCAEFGLHHSLPIYSGGLGFLAGDILKEASDMNLPMVGVGFMYSQGYVKQVLGSDGWQRGEEQIIDKDEAPIERVLDKNGKHLIFDIPFITPGVKVAVWKVAVGKVDLFLLDTDIEQNDPWDRQISYRLYTPDMNQRLRQQIVLGVGGIELLKILGIDYSILHLNEGHPAFALFARIRELMQKGMKKEEAINFVRETSVFTTHTPLMVATDVYSFDEVSKNFDGFFENMGKKEDFFAYGINPDNPNGLNMTVLALNLCKYKNAVSKKHCEVSNNIWKNTLKKLNEKIDYVTNGVHLPTWVGDELLIKYLEILGDYMELEDEEDFWEKVDDIDDKFIWKQHQKYKMRMINFILEKIRHRWASGNIDPSVVLGEGVFLDNDVLTIVFARRMTAYKRPDLILKDEDRLNKILNDPEKPVQLIFAGKAHPADVEGKKIIQRIFRAAMDPKFKGRIAFIEDYGEYLAKELIKGADVWLNNPKPPLEASGTSGMKAGMNGVLHLSICDGWWCEGYNGKNGWQFGSGDDEKDANELYDLIEKEIVPMYYERDEKGLPKRWIAMMKESIKSISPKFSARRMMNEYKNKFYVPATNYLKKVK
jgi:starch phosphorylase